MSTQRQSDPGVLLQPFQELMASRSEVEPGAIQALRHLAAERFVELGIPSRRLESWRHTNVSRLGRTPFRMLPDGGPRVREKDLQGLSYPGLPRLVVVDGRFASDLSWRGEDGVEAEALETALAAGRAAHLGSLASFTERAFVALNTALFQDGVVLRVAPGVTVDRPLQILFLTTAAEGGEPVVSYPRLVLDLGRESRVEIVETYAGLGGGTALTCAVTETFLQAGASLRHYRIQREGTGTTHIATHRSRLAEGSTLETLSADLGAALARNEIHTDLDGSGSFARLSGLSVLKGRQHVDNQLRVEHRAPHGSSHQVFKGILEGSSRGVFNGLIHVHKGAQKTDAKQTNRNLLLSDSALVRSNPQLEIFADDVRCTHGSTVGQLDAGALFYLRSRGLSELTARELLLQGFAGEVLDAIRWDPLRRDLEQAVRTSILGGDSTRRAA